MSEIYDYHLQSYLKQVINSLPINQQMQLKSIRLCNNNVIRAPGATEGVYLLHSEGDKKSEHKHLHENKAKIFGQVTCKNPFACPCCTAKMMSKYKAKIQSAIDAMRAKGYYGFMMTFTIAHLPFMSNREITDILYKTWKYCFARNSKAQKAKRSHGYRAFQEFYHELDIVHRVRVCEYTYGENGWHPHFHCIFWIKRDQATIDKVLEWEDKLNEYWEKYALKYTEQYWKENYLHKDKQEEYFKAISSCYNRQKYVDSKAIFFSRDKDGKLLEALTSDYIAGWGADSELTGNVRKKASHNEHYTPYQILEKAAAGDKKFEELYIEFMLQVTRKPVHHRVDTSTGLTKIITEYRNTEGFQEVIKKKEETRKNWQVIGFFTSEQWWKICHLNKQFPIIANILYLAAHKKELISEFLEFYDIKMYPPGLSNVSEHIENIYNNVAA